MSHVSLRRGGRVKQQARGVALPRHNSMDARSPNRSRRSTAMLLLALLVSSLLLGISCTERKRRSCVRACAAETRQVYAQCKRQSKAPEASCREEQDKKSLLCLKKCL